MLHLARKKSLGLFVLLIGNLAILLVVLMLIEKQQVYTDDAFAKVLPGEYETKSEYLYPAESRDKDIVIDLEQLAVKFEHRLENEPGKVAWGVYDPTSKERITYLGDEVLPPASISKLVYAVLLLRDVDKGIYQLSDKMAINSALKAYESDDLYHFSPGTKLSLARYLEYLIVESDNTAMLHIENLLGGYMRVNSRARAELGDVFLQRWPHQTTINDVVDIAVGINDETFLEAESNQFLINLMINTAPRFHNRIKAGAARIEGITVAHKIGNLVVGEGLVINDVGILSWGDDKTLILGFITIGMPSEQYAADLIADLTEIAIQYMD